MMMRLKFKLFLLLMAMSAVPVMAQKVAIKNNLAYDALRTPNLSLEIGLSKKWTLDTQFGMNSFFYSKDATADDYKTKKWSHWMLQPEFRYWTCERFNGFFMGIHAHGGQINIGQVNIPYFILENKDNEMDQHRYEAYFYGAGLSLGYQWYISPRWTIEASVGAGYARIHYDKFPCTACGTKVDSGIANYVGPTKATLSLVFFLK